VIAAAVMSGEAAVSSTQTASSAPPKLTVRATPPKGRPGAIIALSIRSDRRLRALDLSGVGSAARLEPDGSGRAYRGLLGIDLDRKPGAMAFSLTGTDEDGRAFSILWSLRVESGRFPVERLKVDPAMVEPPADALPRIEAEHKRTADVWAHPDERRRWTAPFAAPVDAVPQANFGVRRVYNGQEKSRHGGVDYRAASGTAVEAPAAGRVALAAELYFSGGTVILDHGAGLFTSYFHLSRIDVAEGELVEEGKILGAVGATGRVTGPHLHWSARFGAARINPLDLRRLPEWPAQ
jgi:murein DD-endopeptidase MepM/ murein hydrolase activator NlpD